MPPPPHPIKRQLENLILPPIVMARHLETLPYYRFERIYTFATAVWAGLVSAGILSGQFATPAAESSEAAASATTAAALPTAIDLATLGEITPWVTMGGLIVGVVLKVVREQYNTSQKYEVAKLVANMFKGFDLRLEQILAEADPTEALNTLQANIQSGLDSIHSVEGLPWANYNAFPEEVAERSAALCDKHASQWLAPTTPTIERREIHE